MQSVDFRIDYGEDDTGNRMKYLRHGGGYYINVGCSDLIAGKSIGLLQYDQIDQIVGNGLRLADGTIVEADLIVMATGFENQQALVKQIFGTEVADHVGPIWGYDAEGELRGMYKRSGQPGLWFHAGSLTQSRVYSRLIALQIKACLTGLIEPNLRDGVTRAPGPVGDASDDSPGATPAPSATIQARDDRPVRPFADEQADRPGGAGDELDGDDLAALPGD